MALATLKIVTGTRAGQTVGLLDDSYVIGSDEGASITCLDRDVEWSHARIYHDRERFWVEDLQSRGGVLVNGRPVLHKSLRDGDRVRIGAVELQFMLAALAAEAPRASAPSWAPAVDGAEPAGVVDLVDPDAEPAPAAPRASASEADRVASAMLEMARLAGASAPAPRAGDAPRAAAAEAGDSDLDSSDTDALALDADATDPDTLDAYATTAKATDLPPAVQPQPMPAGAIDFAVADVETLRRELERVQEENVDLRARLAAREADLKRKSTGLSLATESFVEQLERAKERIQVFAKKHTESEERARKQAEEIARLKAEKASLEGDSSGRVNDLTEKLETVRRDFEEIERVLRAKGQAYAKIVAEAREMVRSLPVTPINASDIAAQMAALDGDDAPGAGGGGGGGAGAVSAAAAAKRRGRGSGIVPVSVTMEQLEDPSPGASAAGTSLDEAEEHDELTAAAARRRGRGSSTRTMTIGAIFLLLFCFAFMLFILVQRLGQNRRAEPPLASTAPSRLDPAPRAPSSFPPATMGPGATTRPAVSPRVETPRAAPAPAAPAPARPAAPAPEAEGSADDALAALREAHRSRDNARIAAAEQALIASGAGRVDEIRKAYDEERQFPLKVSLQFVLLALEGQGTGRAVLDQMRLTRDQSEKMRLAFVLLKLPPEEAPALEKALGEEQDPMVKKYIVRALGEMTADGGIDTLASVARTGDDRQLRIEAIRAIERRSGPDAARLLEEVTTGEAGRDEQIRSIGIRALANVGGPEQSAFFVQVLQQDERTNNRAEAAKFFSRAGTAQDLPTLEAVVQQEKVYYIRERLEKAVEQVKRREGLIQ